MNKNLIQEDTIEHIRNDLLGYYDENLLLADGYDDCIIGICNRFGQSPIVAYDQNKIIEKLMSRDDMSYEDAQEFFDFNIIGAWMGDNTPCFVNSHQKNSQI